MIDHQFLWLLLIAAALAGIAGECLGAFILWLDQRARDDPRHD